MASLLFEAIEIITDNGLGVPVSYLNTGIGLMSDGHFALMTDRFTVTTATGDSTRTDWVQGILTRDLGNWTLSRNIDFVEAGAFESVSDFQVGIKNISDFRATLQANGVYLGRRKVKYYRATSTDGVTWNFELRWTGVVDDQPFNELRQSLKCVSTSKDIFGTLPTVPANKTAFPLMPDDSQDKMIPIALGRVARSPMVNVRGGGDKAILMKDGATEYMFCSSVAYDKPNRTLTLLTGFPVSPDVHTGLPGMQFAADDNRLVDHYLHVAIGNDQKIRIIGNDASSQAPITITVLLLTFTFYPWTTKIYLADELDEAGGSWVRYGLFGVDSTSWYFEVLDLANTLIASTKPVSEIIPLLTQWSSDTKAFKDVSEVLNLTSTTNIDASGFPGVSVHANKAESGGGFANYQPIPPQKIVVVSKLNWGISDLPDAGSEAPLLIDRSDSTSYSTTPSAGTFIVVLDVYLPTGLSEKDYSEFAILYDYSGLSTGTDQDFILYATVEAQDIYGKFYTFPAINEAEVESYAAIDGVVGNVNGLPRKYVNSTGSDSHFYALKGALAIQDLLSDSKRGSVYNRIRLTLKFQVLYPSQFTLKLKEIGFVGKTVVNASTETLYAHNRGELYGNTMDGRVTATDYPDSVVRVLEYLIRNYDEKALPWKPSHAYAAGEFARGTADTGHVFVVTGPGASSATEPTWTDTPGATYTDGSVTWKEHHEIPIDTASFDTAAGHRGFWLVGRTLTEKKASLDYYQQLLAQSFLLGVMTPAGKVQVKAWLQNTTPLIAFSEANILTGTLSDVVETPVRRLYNLPTLKYDKNPASGAYNKQMAFSNIDKPSFPGVSETTSDGVSLGAFTATAVFSFDFTNPTWVVTFVTSAPHNRASGDYLSLSGNTDGFDFSPAPATVIDANTIRVAYLTINPTANPSSSGTLFWNSNFRLKWHDYVAGIDNYSTARDLWQQFRNSYLVTQVANPLPDQLSQCEWFFDLNAQDANGKYIFSTDGGETPEYDLGDSPAVLGFAQGLASWTAWKKKQVTMEVADNATFFALGLGDCVSFSDAKLTAGTALIGWIHEKTQLPRTDGSKPQPERFRFGVTLYPEALNVYVPPGVIEEHGATDIIDEHGATNIIEEHGA